MTVTEWLTIMVIVAVAEVFWLAGESLYRQVVGHHRVPHYKLRASRSRRATTVARPASRSNARLGAGTELQAGHSRLERGSAERTSSVEPQPASAPPQSAGAGPHTPVSGHFGGRSTTHDRGAAGQCSEPAPGVTSSCPGAGPQLRVAAGAPPDASHSGGPDLTPAGTGAPTQYRLVPNLATGGGLEGDGQRGSSSVLAVQAT